MKRISSQSGQVLMISILVIISLLIAVPVLVFVNQGGTRHGVLSQKKQKARSVAEQGLTFAIERLGNTWLVGSNKAKNFVPPECDGTTTYGVEGGTFTVLGQMNPVEPKYWIQLVARGFAKGATSTLQAVVARRTVGVRSPNGVNASAALQMGRAPTSTGGGVLEVHWGPIICLDPAGWDPTGFGTIDTQRYPRKFLIGPIGGAARTEISDSREYWSRYNWGFPPLIDLPYYKSQAQSSSGITPPHMNGPLGMGPLPANPLGSGYFDTLRLAPAIFGRTSVYQLISNTSVLYVDGDVVLKDVALDFEAMIVSGSVTLGGLGGKANTTGLQFNSLIVPPHANAEYPYQGDAVPAPCQSLQGQACTVNFLSTTAGTNSIVQMRGFLYVTGDLTVADGQWYHLIGVVRVDGRIILGTGSRLTIHYDDRINQGIGVSPVEVYLDSLREIPS